MITYYIESGVLREAVQATSPIEAMRCAFMRAVEKEPALLGFLTRCSTHGFLGVSEDIQEDDVFISTETMLRKVGLMEQFDLHDKSVDEDLTNGD